MSNLTDEKHPYAELTNIDVNTETKIGYQAIPHDEYWLADFYPLAKREYYEKLHGNSTGRYNGVRRNSKYQTHLDNRNLIEAVRPDFGLTSKREARAEAVFHTFNLRKWGIRKEIVAAVLCLYLIHSDGYDQRECHPNTADETSTEELKSAMTAYGFDERVYRQTYARIEQAFNGRLVSKTKGAGGVYKGSAILISEENPAQEPKPNPTQVTQKSGGHWFPSSVTA